MEYDFATVERVDARGRFDHDDLLDNLLAALASRGRGTSPAIAVAEAMIDQLRRQPERPAEVSDWRGSTDESSDLWSEPLLRWKHFEDRVTEALAREAGQPALAVMRFHAIELVGLVRCIVSTEPPGDLEPTDHCCREQFACCVRNVARAMGDPVGRLGQHPSSQWSGEA
jgi:hypothetical protein